MTAATGIGPRPRRAGPLGFTLLEMGLVIAILGLLAYLIADFHVNQLKLRAAERRIDGVVRDVRSIVDASLAWAATIWGTPACAAMCVMIQLPWCSAAAQRGYNTWCGIG